MHLLTNRKSPFIIIALFIVLGVGLYLNTMNAPFQFDDRDFITQSENIKDITDMPAIWNALGHPSRFVTFVSFALNYHFNQYRPFGYHVVNVALHILNTLLVWIFIQLLYKTQPQEKDKTKGRLIALVVALVFLAHPLQTQAVSYITQRFASLATLFYLLTLCLYIKGRLKNNNIGLFTLTIITMLIGMFTKQIAFTMPFIIILTEYVFLRKKSSDSNTT
ncbi:MAG: hypothetical protein ACI9E5_001445, partial [Candidatus Omnitrophota bacterium]